MPETLYSQEDVARLFGVTVHAVRKWRAQRKIGFIRVNETVRFTEDHIALFIEQHRHPATALPTRTCACA